MAPLAHKWDPTRGKWKMRQVIRAFLETSCGSVTEEDLLEHLSSVGYHPTATRRVLRQFVEVDAEGHVSLRRGG